MGKLSFTLGRDVPMSPDDGRGRGGGQASGDLQRGTGALGALGRCSLSNQEGKGEIKAEEEEHGLW